MHDHEPSDAELVAQSLVGNREAFGQLYDRYARLVRAVAHGATCDWSAVHDLAQETFLRAYRNLGRLREPDRFGAWVVGIARQVARERRRSLYRDRHEFVDGRSLEVASAADNADRLDDVEEAQWILQKVAELDHRERLAIHAFFLDGRDVRPVSELLGLSRSGTYALLARAVARLAELVGSTERKRGTRK